MRAVTERQSKVTASQAAYLGELLRLGGASSYVAPGAWSRAMGVSPAAASRMARRLEAAGWIERAGNRGLRLTERGRLEGARAVRAHRLAEAYLVRVLGYGWHEAHDTADRLGEIADETLVARLEAHAGFPRRCPHGEPIPAADGTIQTLDDLPLQEVPVGATGVISRVRVRDADRLQYLEQVGAVPEAPFAVLGRAPFGGAVRTRLPPGECAFGEELARVIWVELDKPGTPPSEPRRS